MMHLPPFPGTGCPAIKSITVEAICNTPHLLQLIYRLAGDLNALRIPASIARPAATPLLWQHTCFEIFCHTPGAEAYTEYNFSPSLAWDHYRFSAYRQQAAQTPKVAPQLSILKRTASHFALQAVVPLATDLPLDLGLAAVIEDTKGDLTYYALAHPAEKPDFHAPGGFITRV